MLYFQSQLDFEQGLKLITKHIEKPKNIQSATLEHFTKLSVFDSDRVNLESLPAWVRGMTQTAIIRFLTLFGLL